MTKTANASRQVHALLTDGSTVPCIRPVLPGDHERVLRLYDGRPRRTCGCASSPRTGTPHASPPTGSRLATPGRRALLAESGDELVGVAEYDTLPGTGTEAEVGLGRSDHWHHRGAGTLLLEHLVSLARADGVIQFCAEALAENHALTQVFADLGLQTTRHFDGPEVHCTVRLAEDETYLSAVDLRGTADVASLRPLLRPRSVAVIGPGRHPGSVGRAVLRKLRHGGFTGRLFAVHPHAPVVLGTPTYPNVQALPLTPLIWPSLPCAPRPRPSPPKNAERGYGACSASSGLDAQQAGALRSACRWYGMRPGRPQLPGDRRHGPEASVSTRRSRPIPRSPARPASPCSRAVSASLCCVPSRYRRVHVRLPRRQVRRERQRPAPVVGARPHRSGAAPPRVLRQSTDVLRTARRVTRADARVTVDAGRTDAGRRAAASHTAAAATSTMTRQAQIHPGRHHRHAQHRRTARDRGTSARPTSAGRTPDRGGQQCRRHGCARRPTPVQRRVSPCLRCRRQ